VIYGQKRELCSLILLQFYELFKSLLKFPFLCDIIRLSKIRGSFFIMKNALKTAAALVLAAVACFLGSMNCFANAEECSGQNGVSAADAAYAD